MLGKGNKMPSNDSIAAATLSITRVFASSIERVFAAWTTPEFISQWFGPEGFEVLNTKCELLVGGKYSISLRSPKGGEVHHFGEYVQIERPYLLVFTWILSDQDCVGSAGRNTNTLVSIRLAPHEQGTELTLVHEKLPDTDALKGHRFGWEQSLLKLQRFLA